MNKQIVANFLDMDVEGVNELTENQKKAINKKTIGIYIMPSFYTHKHLVFISEGAVSHWEHYAGFQYLVAPELMRRNGNFIVAYSTDNDTDDRIREYLDIIEKAL